MDDMTGMVGGIRVGARCTWTEYALAILALATFHHEPCSLPKGTTGLRRLRKWRRGRRKLYRMDADARRMLSRGD